MGSDLWLADGRLCFPHAVPLEKTLEGLFAISLLIDCFPQPAWTASTFAICRLFEGSQPLDVARGESVYVLVPPDGNRHRGLK